MRLGLFMMPVHPPGRSLSSTLAEDTAKSLLADQLGFDELWMGEHFSAITAECVLHGSPSTLLDKLVAFRENVGPFGGLLQTGLDWGGKNQEWERESMRLLAQEVMPKFRQHCEAQREAAE